MDDFQKAAEQKARDIRWAQEKKNRAISDAITRNEKMWAKEGACRIVAAVIESKQNTAELSDDTILNMVENLSKEIYRMNLE